MELDSIFIQGESFPCKDYVINSPTPPPFIVLSDGCSSEEFTDIGSRLISHGIIKNKEKFPEDKINNLGKYLFDINEFLLESFLEIETLSKNIGFADHRTPLFSTLLILKESKSKEKENIDIIISGDGIIIYKEKNKINFIEITQPDNAPFYYIYSYNNDFKKSYLDTFKPFYIERKVEYNISEENNIIFSNEEINEFKLNTTIPFYFKRLNKKEINSVFISSDGLFSFYKEKGTTKSDMESLVISNLIIKSKKGNFLKRKLPRLIESMAKENYKHYDDISIGGVIYE